LTRAQAKQIRDSAQTALAEAVKARDSAQAKLNVLLAGTREERVRLAEAALEAARAEAAAAGDGLRNAEELHEDRLAARQGRDAAETALDSATARQRMARAELGLLLAGATEEAIDAARGRLAEAEAALGAAEVRRSYCEIEAPCAGTVTDVVTDLGETAATGTTVVVVSDLENMWLRAYVGFANLGQVTLGETFSIATEAVPERAFAGTVIRVSDEAEFTPKDVQTPDQRMTQVYWVKVGVGDGMGLLKPGMPADLLPAD
ncbi:MAG TPA: efflux RND transporter periplasmic adaptor subunit, partial [Armatimonadota bacterium]|nr:efflux RND transporter periplasmic adaptor subunit [Armatimonadota bacterium]